MEKTYYYHFRKADTCFWAMGAALVITLIFYDNYILWPLLAVTVALWGYKNLVRQRAVIITDKTIQIDHSRPIAWQDIQDATFKTVYMCRLGMRILSLNPKAGISYRYNWLQRHNGDFGAFPIPLYGILSPADEQEITETIRKHVTIKK